MALWDDEKIVAREDFLNPQQLRCTSCGHVASIDLFEVGGADMGLPEYGIEESEGHVYCPACHEDMVPEILNGLSSKGPET